MCWCAGVPVLGFVPVCSTFHESRTSYRGADDGFLPPLECFLLLLFTLTSHSLFLLRDAFVAPTPTSMIFCSDVFIPDGYLTLLK